MSGAVLLFTPVIFPANTGDDTGVFGALLIIELRGKFGRSKNLLLERFFQERTHELGECDTHFGSIFRVVVVDKS